VEAVRERAPLVLICADTSAEARGHPQKIDQASVVAPTGAGFERARSSATAPLDLARAIRRAKAQRLPVVFNVPSDLQWADVEYSRGADLSAPELQAVVPDPVAMDTAVGIIASARRPIVLAGGGATSPRARESVQRLADKLGAPLATTLVAKGLFAGAKYDLGVFGTFSAPRAVNAIMASDCIVAVGASLNEFTGGGRGLPYFDGKRVVHCDTDPAAIGRQCPADAGVVADAAAFADMAAEWLEQAGYAGTHFRAEAFGAQVPDDIPARAAGPDHRPGLTAAMLELNAALPADRTVVVDGGRFAGEAIRHLDAPRPQSWLCPWRGFAAIGNSTAVAVGAACAPAGAPAVAVTGDGGFMLGGLAEFNTAVRYGLDVIIVVCNDGAYGAEYAKFRARGLDCAITTVDWPDLAPVAAALGGEGFTVATTPDLSRLRAVIDGRERPLLIDIKLNPESVPHTSH
jgi:acetolactate synthase-1/2/3 large subunit